MKNLLILLVLSATLSLSAQQQLPNNDFENWSISSTTGTFDPDGWYTLNILTQDTNIYGTKRTTDAYSGQYALKLISGHVDATPFGFPLVDTTAQATIGTLTSSGPNDGMSYTDRPNKLTFYYKYTAGTTPSNVVDTGLLYFKFNGPSGDIGEGIFQFYGNAVTNYTLVEIPITWWNTNTPDSLFLNISSSTTGFDKSPSYVEANITNQIGSVLYIDKIEFSNYLVGNNTLSASTAFNVYPNPSNGSFFILRKDKKITKSNITIWDALGNKILEKIISSNQVKFNLPNGIYFLKVDNINEMKKIVITN